MQDIIRGVGPEIVDTAALRGEPSYVWRAGQRRRFDMIRQWAGPRLAGRVLDNGCGVGMYTQQLAASGADVTGLEFEWERARQARRRANSIVAAAGERLPLVGAAFDLVVSHEVLEHVADDRQAVVEMLRVLRPRGRLVVFCPNRGYPFETHGTYWRGKYSFGNKLFVNYLPSRWRNVLAPHVRVYSARDLARLFEGLPATVVQRTVIFGAYDNLIARFGLLGRLVRGLLQLLEKTPLRVLGLSHFWVVEKT